MSTGQIRRVTLNQQAIIQFSCESGNDTHELGTGFLYIRRNISAVKKVGFVSDTMSYIILRGRWCDIILNAHASTEDTPDKTKESFYEELEHVFNKFPTYHMKILLGDFNAKACREDIFKPTAGNTSS